MLYIPPNIIYNSYIYKFVPLFHLVPTPLVLLIFEMEQGMEQSMEQTF